MRVRVAVLVVAFVVLLVPAEASADCVHVVTPGESLTSIAAVDGLSIGQLAAANGLSSAAGLITGSCLTIPPQSGPALPQSAPVVPGTGSSGGSASTGSSGGSYVVQPGDTLSAIAARAGMSLSELAAANGIDPMAPLLSGTVLQLSGGGQAAAPSPVVYGDGDNDGDDVGTAGSTSSSGGSSGGSYVVQPGDTLTAIAARAGMSVSGLAAANGINPMAPLLSGTVLQLSGAGQAAPAPQAQATGGGGGSYVVQPGDTLSAIAARAGTSVDQLAATNGLDPLAPLLSGTVLLLSGGGQTTSLPQSQTSAGSPATAQPVGAAAQGSPVNPPYPTQETVSPSQVGAIAAADGVPPALAEAIAYQESGFNNAAVSSADARGVMQILPGTWQYIQNTLVNGAPPLAPASATDNIRGGVLLLHSLLNATGGNAAAAAAGYFQGLPSVQANGLYPDTQQYVNNVLALEQRFNGGG